MTGYVVDETASVRTVNGMSVAQPANPYSRQISAAPPCSRSLNDQTSLAMTEVCQPGKKAYQMTRAWNAGSAVSNKTAVAVPSGFENFHAVTVEAMIWLDSSATIRNQQHFDDVAQRNYYVELFRLQAPSVSKPRDLPSIVKGKIPVSAIQSLKPLMRRMLMSSSVYTQAMEPLHDEWHSAGREDKCVMAQW